MLETKTGQSLQKEQMDEISCQSGTGDGFPQSKKALGSQVAVGNSRTASNHFNSGV
jgi:hypothetical protein